MPIIGTHKKMIKILTLVFCLVTFSVCGQEPFDKEKWVAPYEFPIPEGWGKERIVFPIKFAPSIPYKGMEEIRFMPGWANAASEEYWSYAFLWYLDGKKKIDTKTMVDYLKIYYEGLPAATKSIPREKLITAVITNKTEAVDNYYELHIAGTIYMLDYMSQKPITLNYLIRTFVCEGEDKTFVLFQLSPQPYKHELWKKLDKLNNDFKCKK